MQDFLLVQDNFSLFDIEIDKEKRVYKSTQSLDTAISFQLFVDQRVTQQERSRSRDRRGWVGDMQTRGIGYIHGSLLHLQEQARDTNVERNETAAYAKNALEYLVEIGASKEINANVVGKNVEGTIINSAGTTSRYSKLWKSLFE